MMWVVPLMMGGVWRDSFDMCCFFSSLSWDPRNPQRFSTWRNVGALHYIVCSTFPWGLSKKTGSDQMSRLVSCCLQLGASTVAWVCSHVQVTNRMSLPFSILVLLQLNVWKIVNNSFVIEYAFSFSGLCVFHVLKKKGNGRGENRGHWLWTLMIKGKWIFNVSHLIIVTVFVSIWK